MSPRAIQYSRSFDLPRLFRPGASSFRSLEGIEVLSSVRLQDLHSSQPVAPVPPCCAGGPVPTAHQRVDARESMPFKNDDLVSPSRSILAKEARYFAFTRKQPGGGKPAHGHFMRPS